MREMAAAARTPKLRTMRQFAEEEIILPTGPFAGRRFRVDRNPVIGLLFDEVDSGKWSRIASTGPRQSGKSLGTFVIPTLYHLFEIGETVIMGVPTLEMAGDKWAEDLLPVIKRTKYAGLLPKAGAGSKGGKVTRIEFGNGATLRFMTAGGNDKKRAGFSSRVLVVTETDGMDEAGGTSRESDKITQMEGCTRSHGDRARIYLECTVSIEKGRIWQEVKGGTDSRIALRCPHCEQYVTPEREHLTGWQEASDALSAGEGARLVCPGCGVPWDEDDRHRANHTGRLVHHGQAIASDGTVAGSPKRTQTLGFRYTAANNLLVPLRVLGQDEWKAARAADEDNADKAQRQYVWVLPAKNPTVDLTEFDATAIAQRTTPDPRGRVPSWARRITVGIDVGKWLCHWTAVAWGEHATPHVIEYGRLEVPSREVAEELAILLALRRFRDEIFNAGWPCDGGSMRPAVVFVDVGYKQETVRDFVAESGAAFWGCKGFGDLSDENGRHDAKLIGKGQDSVLVDLRDGRPPIVEAVANAWKSWLHARLQNPKGQPGAMTLFNAPTTAEHIGFAKHLTAEKKVEEFVAGKGLQTKWVRVNRNNHWLDSSCLACVAGWWAGERLIGEIPVAPPPPKPVAPTERPNWVPDRTGSWVR
jgi:phage terminase large subunit GpA-like protein